MLNHNCGDKVDRQRWLSHIYLFIFIFPLHRRSRCKKSLRPLPVFVFPGGLWWICMCVLVYICVCLCVIVKPFDVTLWQTGAQTQEHIAVD